MTPLVLFGAALGGASIYLLDRRHRHGALDDALVERVRANMGRYAAHPGAIEVSATNGRVTVTGSIFAHEHTDLLDALNAMDDVCEVVDHLSVFETAEWISELQSERKRTASAMLAPGTPLLAGSALALYLLMRSSRAAALLALALGAALSFHRSPPAKTQRLSGMEGSSHHASDFSAVPIAPEEVF